MRQIASMAVLSLLSAGGTALAVDPNDWAQLDRYRGANAALAAPAAGEPRVVFMGDSIIEGWSRVDPEYFSAGTRINRGIGGQTTSQMLVRFRADVIALRPKVVVILAGTNDIAGNTGPITEPEIVGNIASMAELARTHGIRVVLVSALPADRYYWNPAIKPAARIVELNRLLAAYAKQQGLGWVDLHALLADANKGLKRGFGEDGVHPNRAAYRAMRQPVEEAIVAALR
jgi:lysophospholipase L1-like esterase